MGVEIRRLNFLERAKLDTLSGRRELEKSCNYSWQGQISWAVL